jgi:hypothetical protein
MEEICAYSNWLHFLVSSERSGYDPRQWIEDRDRQALSAKTVFFDAWVRLGNPKDEFDKQLLKGLSAAEIDARKRKEADEKQRREYQQWIWNRQAKIIPHGKQSVLSVLTAVWKVSPDQKPFVISDDSIASDKVLSVTQRLAQIRAFMQSKSASVTTEVVNWLRSFLDRTIQMTFFLIDIQVEKKVQASLTQNIHRIQKPSSAEIEGLVSKYRQEIEPALVYTYVKPLVELRQALLKLPAVVGVKSGGRSSSHTRLRSARKKATRKKKGGSTAATMTTDPNPADKWTLEKCLENPQRCRELFPSPHSSYPIQRPFEATPCNPMPSLPYWAVHVGTQKIVAIINPQNGEFSVLQTPLTIPIQYSPNRIAYFVSDDMLPWLTGSHKWTTVTLDEKQTAAVLMETPYCFPPLLPASSTYNPWTQGQIVLDSLTPLRKDNYRTWSQFPKLNTTTSTTKQTSETSQTSQTTTTSGKDSVPTTNLFFWGTPVIQQKPPLFCFSNNPKPGIK